MIKTWRERCEEHPDHQSGVVTHAMVQARMQEEIDELRDDLAAARADAESWYQQSQDRIDDALKFAKERDEARAECEEQARLVGMGSEREARLMAERDEARADSHRARMAGVKLLDERDALAEALRMAEEQRDAAVRLLAEWCVQINHNGTGWDDWDESYKDADYRPGPLRELIDAAKKQVEADWGFADKDSAALGQREASRG